MLPDLGLLASLNQIYLTNFCIITFQIGEPREHRHFEKVPIPPLLPENPTNCQLLAPRPPNPKAIIPIANLLLGRSASPLPGNTPCRRRK